MSGLANWKSLRAALTACFVVSLLMSLWLAGATFALAPVEPTWAGLSNFAAHAFKDYKTLSGATGAACMATGAVFWLFARYGWRYSVARKVGLINFPDLSGTWHAKSFPASRDPFTSVVVVEHSFYRLQMTIIRNQSVGRSIVANLLRTDTKTARIYATYYSAFGEDRPLQAIPEVDHGEDHSGTLYLDLQGEREEDAHVRTLRGEYWTNKRRMRGNDGEKGTWGRISMEYRSEDLATDALVAMKKGDREWLGELAQS